MAGVTRAGGYTDYSSAGAGRYTPEIYSGKTIVKFYASTVFGTIASTEYEGEIKGYGDNIIIRRTPDVVVSDYVIGSNFTAADYQTPTVDAVELPIDKAKKFLVKLNTVDRTTADIDLASMFADDAAMQLKIAIDRDVLGNIYSQVAAANAGGTAGAISGDINLGTTAAPVNVNSDNIVNVVLDHGLALDEQNVTDEGRWIVLPSWAIQKLKLSPLKNANETGDSVSTLRNGAVGMLDRFTVYRSNLLSVESDGDTHIISGISPALAFAAQITEMEQLQNPADFGSLMRGLCVYGYKVVSPTFMTHGVINAAAEA